MRLSRFDLIRYGHFTDFSLNFGSRQPGEPDFHIVYGANEAGKSTVRNAFLDFLFGIEKQSGYNFQHPYPSMQIGGLLEIEGVAHDLARIKKDKNDLLDAAGQPVSDTLLTAILGSIDRAGYQTMFSLDDDSLQDGGETILKSEGDLGRLLFSAASGLSEFGDVVDAAKAEAHEFYRPKARNTLLNKAIRDLKDLKDAAARIDVQASDYAVLVAAEDVARDQHEKGVEDLDAARKAFERLRRLTDALRPWRELRGLRSDMEPLVDLPDLPPGWLVEAQDLSRNDAAAGVAQRAAEKNVADLEAEIADIEVDHDILALEERFGRLTESNLRARYVAAEDIPNRERELDAVERDLRDLMQRLGRDPATDPAVLLVSSERSGILDDLLDRRPALENTRDASAEEVEKARERVRASTARLEDLGEHPDMSRLDAVLETVRDAGHDKTIRGLEHTCKGLRRDFDEALAVLAPWSGDGDALFRLSCPDPERIVRWGATLDGLRQEEADLEREHADRIDERDRATADIDVAKLNAGGADDEAAEASLEQRQRVWHEHKSGLSGLGDAPATVDLTALLLSADRFEARMADHDAVSLARSERASDIARMRQARADLVRAETAIAGLARRKVDLLERRTAARSGIGPALKAMSLPQDSEPGFMRAWLSRRDTALSRRQALREAEDDLQAARDQAEHARTLLFDTMRSAGLDMEPDQSIEHMVAMARQASDRAREGAGAISAARSLLDEAAANLTERQQSKKRAEDRFQAWSRDWAAALDGTWLADRGEVVAGVREILLSLNDITAKLERRNDLRHRIEAMVDDRRAFENALETMATEVGAAFSSETVLSVADGLNRRLSQARTLQARKSDKQEEYRVACDALQNAGETADLIGARFRTMCERFPSDDFADLLRSLDLARQKAELANQIVSRERDLMETLGVASVATAETLLADNATDGALDDLRVERANAEQICRDLEAHVSTLFHELKTAETALASVDGDAAVARLEEERRTLLLEIEAQAVHHLNLSIGALVAENALRTYRDRHRTSMMKRAASAFAAITAGAFTGLTTMPGKTSEVLVGLRGDGSSMMATSMSKGTRFQLYLALRIAGYAEFAQHRMAFPFFADDIMETFDDDRSAETFQLLATMPGQVIYLTHHQHLCDIARKVAGDNVVVHTLSNPHRVKGG